MSTASDSALPLVLVSPVLVSLALAALGREARAQGAAERFEPRTVTFLSDRSRLESTADLDGDGDMELVGTWRTGVHFEVQDELGQWHRRYLHWPPLHSYNPGGLGRVSATAVGDFDGDGRDELACMGDGAFLVFEADPAPAANLRPRLRLRQDHGEPGLLPGLRAVATDVDGDGLDDLVALHNVTLVYWRSTGSGFVRQGERSLPVPTDLIGLDLDVAELLPSSPGPEVLVLRTSPRLELFLFRNLTAGLHPPRVVRPEQDLGLFFSSNRVKVAPGDVDGDGDEDVAVFGMDGRYQILRNAGQGSLTLEPVRSGGPATDLADFDGDGDLDGICCGGGTGGGPVTNDGSSTFHVCLNDGAGAFDAAAEFEGVGAHKVAGVVDFDLDGDLDVVAGRSALINADTLGADLCGSTRNSSGEMARLHVGGRASLEAGGPRFVADRLPSRTVCVLVANRADTPEAVQERPFWDGLTCLRQSGLSRLAVRYADASGAVDLGGPEDWEGLANPNTVLWRQHGYQLWYRDARRDASGANATNALRLLLVR